MNGPDPIAFFEQDGLVLRYTSNSIEEMRAVYVDRGRMRVGRFHRNVKRGVIGPVFANLHHQDGRVFWPVYGNGQTEADAGTSAVRRWLAERP